MYGAVLAAPSESSGSQDAWSAAVPLSLSVPKLISLHDVSWLVHGIMWFCRRIMSHTYLVGCVVVTCIPHI